MEGPQLDPMYMMLSWYAEIGNCRQGILVTRPNCAINSLSNASIERLSGSFQFFIETAADMPVSAELALAIKFSRFPSSSCNHHDMPLI